VHFWKPNFSQGNSSVQNIVRYLKALIYVFVSWFLFVLPFAVTFLFFSACLTHLTIFSRGLCDELITHPEESYRLWCVVVFNLENLRNEEALAQWGLSRQKQTYHIFEELAASTHTKDCRIVRYKCKDKFTLFTP
jgi:hypothetical protein